MNRATKIWIPWAVLAAGVLISILLVNPAQSNTVSKSTKANMADRTDRGGDAD